jgi:hypothetical protein
MEVIAMRKFCLALAAVSALVLGGWATYGVAGPPDLTVISDSEAIEAVGGQMSCPTQCLSVQAYQSCYGTWTKPCGTMESCPGYTLWDFVPICGNTMALEQVDCTTTCCNILCYGQYTKSYVPCN